MRRDPYDNLEAMQDMVRAAGFPLTFFVRTDAERLAPGAKARGISAPVGYNVMSDGTRRTLLALRERGAEMNAEYGCGHQESEQTRNERYFVRTVHHLVAASD